MAIYKSNQSIAVGALPEKYQIINLPEGTIRYKIKTRPDSFWLIYILTNRGVFEYCLNYVSGEEGETMLEPTYLISSNERNYKL